MPVCFSPSYVFRLVFWGGGGGGGGGGRKDYIYREQLTFTAINILLKGLETVLLLKLESRQK